MSAAVLRVAAALSADDEPLALAQQDHGAVGLGKEADQLVEELGEQFLGVESAGEVLGDLEKRFGLKRIVLVGDRGMVTSKNLDQLRSNGHGYIVGRNRRRSGEVFDYIQRATGPWIECPVGITARCDPE